eukprot:jgi/Pico_ML_1/50721/g1880.t1
MAEKSTVEREDGYRKPPWKFTGRALYQLNLVKVEDAYQFVPKDLPIVNFFGYTVGGLYLARYDHSPAGNMDEMVVLAGLVWDPPVSCAWASHVFVNKRPRGTKKVATPPTTSSEEILVAV